MAMVMVIPADELLWDEVDVPDVMPGMSMLPVSGIEY